MKRIFFSLLVLSLIGCKNQKVEELREWELDSEIAIDMIEHLRACGNCPNSQIIDSNIAVFDEIKRDYKNVRWVNARYLEGNNGETYCRNRNFPPGSNECNIANYSTAIVEGEIDDTKYYFDIATICPPPDQCDKEEK